MHPAGHHNTNEPKKPLKNRDYISYLSSAFKHPYFYTDSDKR